MVSLQEQSHALATHPLPMDEGGWPVGLMPLSGLTFVPKTRFTGAFVDPENLLDLLATESGLMIVDEDTLEPIGLEVDAIPPLYTDGQYLLTVL